MLDKLQRSSTAKVKKGGGVYVSKSGAIFRPKIAPKHLYLDKTKAPEGFVSA
jgi:hypothetical protein